VINEGVNLIKDVGVEDKSATDLLTSETNKSKSPVQMVTSIALTVAVVTICLCFWLLRPPLNPYTQSVLNLSGNPIQGRSIFVMNCVACHGEWGNGKVGPSLHGVGDRKSDIKLVQQVVSGETPPMPQFQPSPQDMADLLSYLKQL
jgi:cbb3-type cytochrome oxidase cytochrome c subunit